MQIEIQHEELPDECIEQLKNHLIQNYIRLNLSDNKIPLRQFLDRIERDTIKMALLLTMNNQKLVSNILGVKETTLSEKIKRFNLNNNDESKKRYIIYWKQILLNMTNLVTSGVLDFDAVENNL